MFSEFGKVLILFGLILVLMGLVFMAGGKLPVGKLPGDIHIQRGNFHFYFPLATCILLSLILTLVLNLFLRK
ncbi:MAG: DUF2905 domain-containing protein [Candidatus Latescibacterota bacterium]|nr:MAG: DUF2905 domain-containing protein [Candidatus Latescibacterota bacterium]